MSTASKISLLLLVSVILSGCLNHSMFASLEPEEKSWSTAPGEPGTNTQLSVANPAYYLVKPGDTLYSIAFRFGLDYKKLASANQIGQSYRIYEGQSLSLKEVDLTEKGTQKDSSTGLIASNASTENSVTKVNSQSSDSRSADKTDPQNRNTSWIWPHNGKIVRTYRPGVSTQKGIDLSGLIGDSVLAATNGVVVYAGNGLPGYGNLIIVEHANSLLSAYAFTEKILVKEKDQVSSGQKIATMGKQGDQPGLHFEIRQNGKPVNPLGFLPKR